MTMAKTEDPKSTDSAEAAPVAAAEAADAAPDAAAEAPDAAPAEDVAVVDPSAWVYPVGVIIFDPDTVPEEDRPATSWIGEHEYLVDPDTGRISGLAPTEE